ncbi:MAG: caspase family protein [Chitinophagaceae bacterium]
MRGFLFSSRIFIRMNLGLFFCCFFAFTAYSHQPAESRYALVIGVKNYKYVDKLQNTLNDAQDMAAILKSKGFTVIEVYDPKNKREMQEGIRKYFSLIRDKKDAAGLVFYSGHGMQVDGTNYLIPCEANPEIKADLDDQCVSMDYIMGAIEEAGNPLNIFILDACRNNPFRSFYRSNEKGLSMVSTPRGSYIVYATKPGSVASDGNGRNGLFTSKLLKYLSIKGLNIEQVFKKVAADVAGESGNGQRPWIASDYTGDFFFTPGEMQPEKIQPGLRVSKIILEEDFSDNSNGWFTEESKSYLFVVSGGKYRIESKLGGSWITSKPFKLNNNADFEISATISKVSGTDGYYFGMMLGFDAQSKYFHFAGITGWGNYVFADKGQKGIDLVPTKDNKIVKPGNSTNTIQIVKRGNTVKLVVNGQLMGEAPFKSFYGEYFGFQVWSGEENLVLDIDEFTIRELY